MPEPSLRTCYCDPNPTCLINRFFFPPQTCPIGPPQAPSPYARPNPKSKTQISIYDFLAQNHKHKHRNHKHKFQISDLWFSLSKSQMMNTMRLVGWMSQASVIRKRLIVLKKQTQNQRRPGKTGQESSNGKVSISRILVFVKVFEWLTLSWMNAYIAYTFGRLLI